MLNVLVALIPCAIAGVYIFGFNAILLMLVSTLSAVAGEAIIQKLLGQKSRVGDLSAAVTGLILALNLSSRTPWWVAMVGSLFAVIVVKLSLTALFVYVLESGLVMIAVASLLSELTMFAFAVHFSLIGDSAFSFSPKAVSFRERRVLEPMVRQSVPVIAEKALFAFGKTIVNSMCTVYGALMVGAMGVSNNLGAITTNPQNGYQQGSSAIISQNYGAGKYRRMLDAFYATAVINMLLGALISGLELWQLHFLSGLFDGGSDDFRRMIALVYRYEALGAVPLGFNAAVMALLYGLGQTKLTLVLNFARVFVFRIPVFWFLQHCTNFGEASVGIVMMVSNISVAVAAGVTALVIIRRFKREHALS